MAEINYTGGMTAKNKPIIRKLGGFDIHVSEATPLVYKNRLVRFETVKPHFRVRDVLTGECSSPCGSDCRFGSGYTENDVIYGFGSVTRGREASNNGLGLDQIKMFWTDDLKNWQEKIILERPGWTLFNTSVCKGPDGYVMAIEVGSPADLVGVRFTMFFATSKDLFHWEMMPLDRVYSKLRYTACPAIRYLEDGYYYMIYLEELPLTRYAPYIVRTRDFVDWEIGLHNPIMFWDDEDRKPKPGVHFTPEELVLIKTRYNINNSDVDLCEFAGHTHIVYGSGDQQTCSCYCEATYDGPMDQFLKAFFE